MKNWLKENFQQLVVCICMVFVLSMLVYTAHVKSSEPPCEGCSWTLVHASGTEVKVYGCCDEPPRLVETTSHWGRIPHWYIDGHVSVYDSQYALKR